MLPVTQLLADYASSSRFEALPPQIQHEGVRAFVNLIGCAASGAREEVVERSTEVLREFNGTATSVIVGRRERLDALNATFVNALASASLMFHDTHNPTVAHPTSSVVAALLALAERRSLSGEAFVHALILGNEVQCRVGNMLVTPPAESPIGLSMVGLVSGIGAAVAAGKAMEFDAAKMAAAIGLAVNQAGGLREAHGTMASHFTQGHAARCGLLAALLVERGFTCNPTMLEGPKGFAASFGIKANPEVALDGLGESFEIARLAYKPYPCGFAIHPTIDACLRIAKEQDYDPGAIESVELAVNPLALQLCDRPLPKNRDQLFVSLQHWAAAALLEREAGLEQAREALVADTAITALRARVAATAAGDLARDAAGAIVVLRDGTRLEATVLHCTGSAENAMRDDDISVKALSQLRSAFGEEKAERLLAECWRIRSYPAVDALCAILGTE
jgi:2-methylcitrate dehydratase PrpD